MGHFWALCHDRQALKWKALFKFAPGNFDNAQATPLSMCLGAKLTNFSFAQNLCDGFLYFLSGVCY